MAHRPHDLIRRGRDSSRVTVDFYLQISGTVHDKSGHILETHLKFVRQVKRFFVCDNAERDIRLLRRPLVQLIVGAELNVCNGFQGFHQV
jgi:hypothetical protein